MTDQLLVRCCRLFARMCLFGFTVGLVVGARQVRADVIASFSFDGNDYVANPDNLIGANGALNLSGVAGDSRVAVGTLMFSPNLDPTRSLGFAADDYDNALGFSSDGNSDRNLLATDQAIFFNVNVQAGYLLHLQSLSFDSLKTRGSNATGSRVTFSIFVNPAGDPAIDGLIGDTDFVTNLAHDHFAMGQAGAESTGGSFTTGRWNVGAVDLSQPRLQGLTGTATVAIRIYGSDGGTADQDFGIDNLTLSGQVTAIPEPGIGALLAFGASLTTLRRPRRKHFNQSD